MSLRKTHVSDLGSASHLCQASDGDACGSSAVLVSCALQWVAAHPLVLCIDGWKLPMAGCEERRLGFRIVYTETLVPGATLVASSLATSAATCWHISGVVPVSNATSA
ncbi:hypothetical protein MLD38_036192 [Melastoma candidum]|uniref:Uncharacterized protein n=1 Tax=Melastoma candidum TaxID=119954 RepID=A0ACB9LJD3_9MYRT|nr:hypothetical protein MLD38_036192 [Melastoma candidum]